MILYLYHGLLTKETNGELHCGILHEGVVGTARPGHEADGLVRQDKGGGEVTEREGQNHGQTPDTDDDPRGGLRRQAGLQRMDDGHVPAGQRSAG